MKIGSRFIGIIAALVLSACAAQQAAEPASPMAASPQPAATALQPGLAVKYWAYDMTMVSELDRLVRSVDGTPGAPIASLDHKENSGNVLTSSLRRLVGAEITGLIRFPQGGRYAIAANSNDGIRIYIGGKQVTEDPTAHPMKQTPVGEITVDGNTWYPLRILYFQRSGGWGLELLWAPAGRELAIVPADALRHTR